MIVTTYIDSVRHNVASRKRAGSKVVLVPTMGALHKGHLSLIEEARAHGDMVVASIFVNPTQFDNPDDLAAYPQTLERDRELLDAAGVDLLFVPEVASMYPEGSVTSVVVSRLSEVFEGAHRAGHFEGVATVVTKLFNIVQPDVAVFGEKDFQQLRIIEQLVRDLNLPLEIVGGQLIREDDGLAYSSRNRRLNEEERELATQLSHGLSEMGQAFAGGEKEAEKLLAIGIQYFSKYPELRFEYLALVTDTLEEVQGEVSAEHRILLAAHCGPVRLIDNAAIGIARCIHQQLDLPLS